MRLRLEKFEAQQKLAEMIEASGLGMSECRKAMMKVKPSEPNARAEVEAILQRAEQYVLAFKKHTKTAQNLITSSKKDESKNEKAEDRQERGRQ